MTIHEHRQAVLGFVCFFLLVCAPMAGAQQGDFEDTTRYAPKEVRFTAQIDVLEMPQGLERVVFDTIPCPECKRTMEGWHFIGDRKIDSVIVFEGIDRSDDSASLLSIKVHSQELIDIMEATNAIRLSRRIPVAQIGVRDFWDDVRKRQGTLPDLSIYYSMEFASDIAVDSVVQLLRSTGVVQDVGPVTIFTPDQIDCVSGIEAYAPNDLPDTSFWGPSAGMYLYPFDYFSSAQKKGINVLCAWGYFGNGERGSGARVGVIDYPVDTSLAELANLVRRNGSEYVPSLDHGTFGAATIGAIADNSSGIAGIAPDVEMYSYSANFLNSMILAAGSDSCDVIWFPYSNGDGTDPALRAACSTVFALNSVLVVPSGNVGGGFSDTLYQAWPASYNDWCIAVGMTGFGSDLLPESNFPCSSGCFDFVDLVAPGNQIYTVNGNGITTWKGTSASSAIVAALIALARSYDSDLTPEVVVEKLRATCRSDASTFTYPAYDPTMMGAGYVQADEFMREIKIARLTEARNLQQASMEDSIPYLIITADSLVSAFTQLRDMKTAAGTHAEIVSVDSIAVNYSGGDLSEQIRSCLADYYSNYDTRYVLLGGDQNIVPIRYAYNNLRGPGVLTPCDLYYACLDGDWNYDSDTLWGETEDDVDLVPELAVGRLPVSGASQVTSYANKLKTYLHPSATDWIERITAIGGKLYVDGDGEALCQDVLNEVPPGWARSELYDTPTGIADRETFFDSVNAGQGILLEFCQAHTHGGNFFIRNTTNRELIHWDDIDTLSNDSMPAVVLGATCFNGNIDSNCIAEHYINHPTGGAIAYIGTSLNDFSFRTVHLMEGIVGRLFDSASYRPGDLLNQSRDIFREKAEDYDGSHRHTMYGYSVLGDPHLPIWTAAPESLNDSTAATLDIIDSVVTVKITSQGSPVDAAVVCIWKQEEWYDDSYSVGTTDANGEVTFTNLSFRSGGYATVTATKHNHIAVTDSIAMTTQCRNLAGNVNYDKNDGCDMSDLLFLTNYLFLGGPEPPCFDEANVDGSADIDLSDVTYLTNYLFSGGPAPVACP